MNKKASVQSLYFGALCILCTGVASASTTFNISTGVVPYTITSDTITETPDSSFTGTAPTVPDGNLPTGAFLHDEDVTNNNSISSTTWIAPSALQQDATAGDSGTVVYQVTFNLTGFLTTGAELYISFAADDFVSDITLNGTSIFTSGGTEAWAGQTNVTNYTGTFLSAVNTIDFTVPNQVGDGAGSCCGATGLIAAVDVTANSAVPEPGTLGGTGLCLIGLGSMLRRRLGR